MIGLFGVSLVVSLPDAAGLIEIDSIRFETQTLLLMQADWFGRNHLLHNINPPSVGCSCRGGRFHGYAEITG